MTGRKRYLQPFDMLLNAVHDLAELQKARTVSCDSARGIVGLEIIMYNRAREYWFEVGYSEGGICEVVIKLSGEDDEAERARLVDHEFALLDYVMKDRARFDIAAIEELDRTAAGDGAR